MYLSIYLSICKLENEAILRDFVKFWFCSTFTTSKTQQVCETSFKNGKLSAELTASCQCGLRFFHSICLKCCACHEKWCQVIRRAAPVTQNHLSKPEDLMLQNATPLRKSAPWPPNISNILWWTCLLYCACHAKCIFAAFGTATKPSRFAHFWQGAQSLAPATQNDIWKWSVSVSFLQRCALFNISTSKSAPNPSIFYTFDFDMCFAPQRCALFRHLNFQKWSEHEVFCTFWLRNVLRPTTACNFSSLILPHGSAPAALASLLFDPPEPQIIGKTQCFATFLPFRAPASSFFFFFLLTHPTSAAFSSVHMSEVWLLDFLRSYSYHAHVCFSPHCCWSVEQTWSAPKHLINHTLAQPKADARCFAALRT